LRRMLFKPPVDSDESEEEEEEEQEEEEEVETAPQKVQEEKPPITKTPLNAG
jgi:hypothetical protein